MIDFIIRYWMEFVFGLLAGAFSYGLRKYHNLRVQEEKESKVKLENHIIQRISKQYETQLSEEVTRAVKEDNKINKKIISLEENIDSLREGILSLQRKQFIEYCQELLDQSHYITMEEYNQLELDHDAYHALRGNDRGDHYYQRVVDKFNKQNSLNIIVKQ